jgi:hypothetical protein
MPVAGVLEGGSGVMEVEVPREVKRRRRRARKRERK